MDETIRLVVALAAVVAALAVSNWFRNRRDRARWQREYDAAEDLDRMADHDDYFEEFK